MLERIPGGQKIHNTTIVFNRRGDEVGLYRTIHLFDITTADGMEYRESDTVRPGSGILVFEAEGICFDRLAAENVDALHANTLRRDPAVVTQRLRRERTSRQGDSGGSSRGTSPMLAREGIATLS